MPAAGQSPCVPQQPRFVYAPQGTFPFSLLDTGIEGRVVVGVVVGTDGLPKHVEVLESSGHAAFDTEAMRAASRARWRPISCEAGIRFPFNFKQAR